MKQLVLSLIAVLLTGVSWAQAIQNQNIQLSDGSVVPFVECGHMEAMEQIDRAVPGYLEESNKFLQQVASQWANTGQRSSNEVYKIPVVFHLVYNNAQELLPDSVIEQQLAVLNDAFRRKNADTVNLRPEFASLVGDARIEFYLATQDPDGNPTNGITYTSTNVTNFGGILPYGPSQQAQINQWVVDSLYYNFFRITKTALGGIDAWDTDKYMNIWVGDLTILEPQFNNFEEIAFFGLSTPPPTHPNFPAGLLDEIHALGHGTLMHYQAIGPNNPAQLMGPYAPFNGKVNQGKMLVHEAGHYLGLRHIWGDGGCNADDYVLDTPRANASSTFNCNTLTNSCSDTINGADLFDMVENYMDYSESDCQNSFTQGQVNVMRATLDNFRANLFITSVNEHSHNHYWVEVFPNPAHEQVNVVVKTSENFVVQVLDTQGKILRTQTGSGTNKLVFDLNFPNGIYFVKVILTSGVNTYKVVKN